LKKEFYSHGKLLLTAEYLVLDGADALAFPTKFGQSLAVDSGKKNTIEWKSYDHNESLWLDFCFSIEEIKLFNRKVENDRDRLLSILMNAHKINSTFLGNTDGFSIVTKLDFPNNWGLGTSSTLINNVSKWANLDPYKLLNVTFGGSGYDIAAANNDHPIIFTKKENQAVSKKQLINWNFRDQLFFVHLNKKQNSRDSITSYRKVLKSKIIEIQKINKLTIDLCNCNSLTEFKNLIKRHEKIVSNMIQQKPIKEVLFKNYHGGIKSLGAWGGDFILATGDEDDHKYFKKKGFNTIIPFGKMIL
jgi:mevalonate kinase